MQLTDHTNFPAEFFSQFDASWTLFLDRDGVINHEQEDDYIRNWESFHFIDGVLPSFTLFAQLFEKIFIVTNQKGVGKGIMTEGDLQKINDGITHCVNEVNGFIDILAPDVKSTAGKTRGESREWKIAEDYILKEE